MQKGMNQKELFTNFLKIQTIVFEIENAEAFAPYVLNADNP